MNEDLRKKIEEIISEVKHPEIDASLIELGIVKDISVSGGMIEVLMAFPFPGVPIKDMLIDSVRIPLEKLGLNVNIKESVMDDREREIFFSLEQEKWKL